MQQTLSRSRGRAAARIAAVLVVATLGLAGCAGDPGETGSTETTLTLSQPGAETTVTYEAVGDKLTRQTTENTVDYAESGIEDREAAEQQVGALVDQYQGIPGVEHEIEFGDTSLTETVTITYANLDVDKLAQATGVEPAADPEEARNVSLAEAVSTLKEAGFTEVKN